MHWCWSAPVGGKFQSISYKFTPEVDGSYCLAINYATKTASNSLVVTVNEKSDFGLAILPPTPGFEIFTTAVTTACAPMVGGTDYIIKLEVQKAYINIDGLVISDAPFTTFTPPATTPTVPVTEQAQVSAGVSITTGVASIIAAALALFTLI